MKKLYLSVLYRENVAVFITTCFKVGFSPKAPGTCGSLAAIPLCFLLLMFPQWLSGYLFAFTVGGIYWLGITLVPIAERDISRRLNEKKGFEKQDHGQIVIDEVLGMLFSCFPLAVLSVDRLWLAVLVAFVLFRLFDIAKPPGVKYFDDMKTPNGVMMDDVVAGVYASICLGFAIGFLGL